MFFGYAEHKTFVEYFGVTEFAKPQTKTCLGLSILIYPSVIQRLREGGVWREDGEDTASSALSSLPLLSLSHPSSLSLWSLLIGAGRQQQCLGQREELEGAGLKILCPCKEISVENTPGF